MTSSHALRCCCRTVGSYVSFFHSFTFYLVNSRTFNTTGQLGNGYRKTDRGRVCRTVPPDINRADPLHLSVYSSSTGVWLFLFFSCILFLFFSSFSFSFDVQFLHPPTSICCLVLHAMTSTAPSQVVNDEFINNAKERPSRSHCLSRMGVIDLIQKTWQTTWENHQQTHDRLETKQKTSGQENEENIENRCEREKTCQSD